MEQLALTANETVPEIVNTSYRVVFISMDWENALIIVRLRGDNKERKEFTYGGVEATNLMISLNKANLSTLSLQKRILNKLIADGKISGTVTGTPD